MGANQALAALTHADSGDAKEMLSVPAQQLSRVYTLAPETFTHEEMVAMDTYFGNEGYTRYDGTLADFTKNDLSTDVILEDKAGCFETLADRRPETARIFIWTRCWSWICRFCIPIGRMRARPNTLKRVCLRAR